MGERLIDKWPIAESGERLIYKWPTLENLRQIIEKFEHTDEELTSDEILQVMCIAKNWYGARLEEKRHRELLWK